jgi:hypothetical protein
MHPLVPDSVKTRATDLADWKSFCDAYDEPIRSALRLMRVPESDLDDLAQEFLIKVQVKSFLDTYHAFQQREASKGKEARFRYYLYKALFHHVKDAYRGRILGSKDSGLSPELAAALEAPPERVLDPDAVYALGILYQAMHALRRHCERTGKPHIWTIFEELCLADEIRGRRARTRAELLAESNRADPQYLTNVLVTARRAFRRFLDEIIPSWPGDGLTPAERFAEWMEILKSSNAAQFNLLSVAYRVEPFLGDASQAASLAMVVPGASASPSLAPAYEAPGVVVDDDEMSLLLSFRLELPLIQMLDASELRRYVPASSVFDPRARAKGTGAGSSASHRPERPLCLLTLIEPTPAEAEALSGVNVVGLLKHLKSMAKQLQLRTDHSLPELFAELMYTIVNVLALVRYQAAIHTIGPESLARNVRCFLGKPWLDDRLRPLFEMGLEALERSHEPER